MNDDLSTHQVFTSDEHREGSSGHVSCGSDQPSHDARHAPVDLLGLRAVMQDMGIEDAMDLMLAVYLEEAPRCLARLNRAMAEKEVAAIESAAHAMKSVSGSIKADALADLLRQMEEAARTGDLDRATGLIDEVRREYHAVVACMQHVKRLDGPNLETGCR